MRSTSITQVDFNIFANFKADMQAALLEFIGTVQNSYHVPVAPN